MVPIERMAAVSQGLKPDRVPFVPVVYEHAAALIGVTPSQMARSVDLIVQGQLRAYELYRHDLVTVGVDIYNIEAEALGCTVKYMEDNSVPGLANHIISDRSVLGKLQIPDPEHSGRMPLLIEAANRVRQTIGKEVTVGAAMVGPFTLAALLRGYETFIMDMLSDPEFFKELLDFTYEVNLVFGKRIIRSGLGLSINESWITPPLLSPQLYANQVFQYQQRLINSLKLAGAKSVGLISGGDTTPIVDWLVQTGTSLLMADYGTDLVKFKRKAAAAGVLLRGSVQSRLLENGTAAELSRQAEEVLRLGTPGGKFVFGCGVVPYNAAPDRVLFLKKIACEYEL